MRHMHMKNIAYALMLTPCLFGDHDTFIHIAFARRSLLGVDTDDDVTTSWTMHGLQS